MKTSLKVAGSALALLVTLGLHAQATNQTNSATSSPSTTSNSPGAGQPGQALYTNGSQEPAGQPTSTAQNSTTTSSANATAAGTITAAPGVNPPAADATNPGDTNPNLAQGQDNKSNSPTITNGAPATDQNQSASVANAQQASTTMQSNAMASAQSETDITTFVQQIDAQGPAVLDRVTTQFADVTCTPENAKLLFNALHDGTEVSLNADGKTVTFTPAGGKLGYGEAYIAMALAAEALHNAGVTGCATPEQWKSVLIGGPLAASATSSTSTSATASASSTSQFPGILSLHSQGQGWGQVAQTTHVQLGQIVSSAHSSSNLDRDSQLTPTGKTSAEMQQERLNAGKDQDAAKDGHAKVRDDDGDQDDNGHHKSRDRDQDNDKGFEQNQGATNPNTSTTTQPNR